MKKLLALLLAAVMLLACTACAESAATGLGTIELTNLSLIMTSGGSEQVVDLTGLKAALAAGTSANDNATIRLDLSNGDEALLGATIQFIGTQMALQLDGMDAAYGVDLTESGEPEEMLNQGLDVIKMAFASGAQVLDQLVLPAFTGLDIPMFSLSPLVGEFANGTETDANGAQVTSFTIPHETVTGLIDLIGSQAGDIASSQGLDISQVTDILQQLKDSNASLQLEGTITDTDSESTTVIDIFPVQDGQVSTDSVATITLSSKENDAQLVISAPSAGALTLSAFSDPEQAIFSVSLDVAGMAYVDFLLAPDEGLQAAKLNFGAEGEEVELLLEYGEKDGQDVCIVTANAGGVELGVNTATTYDGAQRTGDFEAYMQMGSEMYKLTGAIAMIPGATNLPDITAAIQSIDEIDNADPTPALEPLINYLNTLTPAEAA